MTTTWILTTGNSDIQLKTETNWKSSYGKIKNPTKYPGFDCKPQKTENGFFTVPARILGLVHGQNTQNLEKLEFSLIDGFISKFQKDKIKPDRIILLITNQEHIFTDRDKKSKTCPYWQDTCTAQPIFEKYFREHEWLKALTKEVKKKSGGKENKVSEEELAKIATLEFLHLEPQAGEKGLDSWDSALPLVQNKLKEVTFEEEETVYVSHQAGTPAISSAVQFLSVGQFKRVKFLVSNPIYNDKTLKSEVQLIHSSSYWKEIKFADIKKLLNSRWDFSGAKEILQEFKEQYDYGSTEKEKLSRIINALQIGEDCLNLDIEGAKSRLHFLLSRNILEEVKEDDRLLNLYTQCRISFELNDTGKFLSLVSSFYESVLERIFEHKEGNGKKFTLNDSPEAIIQCCEKIKNISECNKTYTNLKKKLKPKKLSELQNRYDKSKWINFLILSRNNEDEEKHWNNIFRKLILFNFWCAYRNKLIHGAKGISKQRLQEVWEKRDLSKDDNKIACQPDEILENMEAILRNDLKLLKQEIFQQFVGEDADYYIYSAVRSYAIEQLEQFEKSSN